MFFWLGDSCSSPVLEKLYLEMEVGWCRFLYYNPFGCKTDVNNAECSAELFIYRNISQEKDEDASLERNSFSSCNYAVNWRKKFNRTTTMLSFMFQKIWEVYTRSDWLCELKISQHQKQKRYSFMKHCWVTLWTPWRVLIPNKWQSEVPYI